MTSHHAESGTAANEYCTVGIPRRIAGSGQLVPPAEHAAALLGEVLTLAAQSGWEHCATHELTVQTPPGPLSSAVKEHPVLVLVFRRPVRAGSGGDFPERARQLLRGWS